MMPNECRAAGFTLIELMIIVSILSIAGALAVPQYLQWNARIQLRAAASEIASTLTLARIAAMNRNRSVDVNVQTLGGVVRVSAVETTSGLSVLPSQSMMPSVISVVGGPITVSFSSLGTRTSAGNAMQTVALCNSYHQQYEVQIITAGKVS